MFGGCMDNPNDAFILADVVARADARWLNSKKEPIQINFSIREKAGIVFTFPIAPIYSFDLFSRPPCSAPSNASAIR